MMASPTSSIRLCGSDRPGADRQRLWRVHERGGLYRLRPPAAGARRRRLQSRRRPGRRCRVRQRPAHPLRKWRHRLHGACCRRRGKPERAVDRRLQHGRVGRRRSRLHRQQHRHNLPRQSNRSRGGADIRNRRIAAGHYRRRFERRRLTRRDHREPAVEHGQHPAGRSRDIQGRFWLPIQVGAGTGSRDVVSADFDGDGRIDLATGNEYAAARRVLSNSTAFSRAAYVFSRLTLGTPVRGRGRIGCRMDGGFQPRRSTRCPDARAQRPAHAGGAADRWPDGHVAPRRGVRRRVCVPLISTSMAIPMSSRGPAVPTQRRSASCSAMAAGLFRLPGNEPPTSGGLPSRPPT